MKKITEVTRQDILDIIKDGFEVELNEPVLDKETGRVVTSDTIHMWFAGRLDEIAFFSRIYDLMKMPSHDYRYKNARDDISCHLSWGDYPDSYWFLDDERFKLSRYDEDEPLLKFMCEMLHPAVRKENTPWQKYLEKFNELLRPDGYEIYRAENISGRGVYKFREIDHIELPHIKDKDFASKRPIGEGSYAKTFRYTDSFYSKDFVVKKAHDDLTEKEIERFKREFEQMKALRSPFIVEVYSYFSDTREYTMELMDHTLYEYIQKNNDKLSLAQRKSIIAQIIRGYRYLHSQSVFHRDVSPYNVLVNVYDDIVIAKISDFGLVKILDSELTSENSEIKGSLNDPALKVQGFSNYELRHELYAITLLFVFVLTGKLNWAKVKETPIREFMLKGTDPDINNRYQTLDELQQGIFLCIKRIEKGE